MKHLFTLLLVLLSSTLYGQQKTIRIQWAGEETNQVYQGRYLSGLQTSTGPMDWVVCDDGLIIGNGSQVVQAAFAVDSYGGKVFVLEYRELLAAYESHPNGSATFHFIDETGADVWYHASTVWDDTREAVAIYSGYALDGEEIVGHILECDIVDLIIRSEDAHTIYVSFDQDHAALRDQIRFLEILVE